MKNLFKILTVAFFTVAILSSFSFDTINLDERSKPITLRLESIILKLGETKSDPNIKQSIEKYVYFRIYRDNTYYFSNIIWVEGNSVSVFSGNLNGQKNRFKKILKRDFDIDWTAPVQDYQFTDENSIESDRKTRIKQSGDSWKNIDL